jgi:periplasmic nitrate reductase NapD
MRSIKRALPTTEDFGELHITSLVLHALPRHLQRIGRAIAQVPGAELHATGPTGKMVVTLEAPNARQIMARVADLQAIDGVISAVLVYQHAESLDTMNQEMPDEHGP